MHSKWQIWDFFSSFDRSFLKNFNGVLALNTFDPLCLKMIKDFLTRGAEGRVIHYKTASEVTRSWIEEEFQTLSLFGETDCIFIHQAHDLSGDLIDMISSLDLTGRFLLLSFENDSSGAWKKIIKEAKLQTIILESPPFWENNKLLDFVCGHLRLPLSYEAKSWILNSLENTLGAFYHSCCLLKLNYPESKEVSISEVQDLLTLERLDQFALASLFSRKKFQVFFEKLIALEGDFDKMRFFFNFLQSHLIKLIDTHYLQKKNRLTQYDKDLQSTSKLWKEVELTYELSRFNRWELMCKKKDSLLWHEIHLAHLQVLNISN